jgi:hypothetical protein
MLNKTRWNSKLAEDLKLRLQSTAKTPSKLLKDRNDIPSGFDVDELLGLLNNKLPTAFQKHIDYIYALCKQEAKPCAYLKRQEGLVEIPNSMRQKLLSEQQRTGLRLSTLLKRAKITHITPEKIMLVARGRVLKGDIEEFEVVLSAYAEQKDASDVPKKEVLQKQNKPISSSDIKKLKTLQKIGLLPSKILALGENPPEHLKSSMISSWCSKESPTANPQHIAWVLHTGECILITTLDLLKK